MSQMIKDFDELQPGGHDRLVTVSRDNTVKVWELGQMLQSEQSRHNTDIGVTTCLAYNK